MKHQGCKKCDTCIDTLLDDLDILFIKLDSIEDGNKNSSLTFKAHNKLVKLENEFKLISDSIDPSSYGITSLALFQKQIDNYQRNLLPELQNMLTYPLADKMKAIKTLLADAEEFNAEINSLRNKFDAFDTVLNQMDKSNLDSFRVVTDEELSVYEKLVDSIMKRNLNLTIDKYKNVMLDFEEANKTISKLAYNFVEQLKNIDEIKDQNSYAQKSLGELKLLINKAKSIENFDDKDVTFRAYFDNLDQIKNETNHIHDFSTKTLRQIETIVKEILSTLQVYKNLLFKYQYKCNKIMKLKRRFLC